MEWWPMDSLGEQVMNSNFMEINAVWMVSRKFRQKTSFFEHCRMNESFCLIVFPVKLFSDVKVCHHFKIFWSVSDVWSMSKGKEIKCQIISVQPGLLFFYGKYHRVGRSCCKNWQVFKYLIFWSKYLIFWASFKTSKFWIF